MTGYPWSTGDALKAADLNAAIVAASSGVAAGGPFLPLSGGTVVGTLGVTGKITGSGFAFNVGATGAADLTHGIDLYGGVTGANGYASNLNLNVPSGHNFNFLVNAASIGFIDATGINYLPIGASGAAAGTFTALVANGATTLNSGLSFANAVAPGGVTDLSKHIMLGYSVGFNITPGRVNHVATTGNIHAFVINALDRLTISATGLGFNGTAAVAKPTGWGAPTGTATRTTFVTGSVTLPALAEHVKALIDDLTSYGLIGP